MSVVSGIGNIITTIENSVDSEIRKLESDIDSAVTKFGTSFKQGFENIFTAIKNEAIDLKGDVVTDFKEFETLIENLTGKMETVAEKLFHDFTGKSNDALDKVHNAVTEASSFVASSTKYLRNDMRTGIEGVITDAKNEFVKIETSFRQQIVKRANELMSVTKDGVNFIVSGARTDLHDIENLKDKIENDIEIVITDIKDGLVKIKNDIENQLDELIRLTKEELEKMEKKIVELKNTVDKITERAAVVSLIVAGSLAAGIILYKIFTKDSSNDVKTDKKKV